MPVRLPRWTGLLVLPLLVGALLLMHGLDVRAGDAHPPITSDAPVVGEGHVHDEAAPADHGHCADCLVGHAMAACVAFIAAFGGIGLVRRLLAPGHRGSSAFVTPVADRIRRLVDLARPPDPAWVRLSVMRC